MNKPEPLVRIRSMRQCRPTSKPGRRVSRPPQLHRRSPCAITDSMRGSLLGRTLVLIGAICATAFGQPIGAKINPCGGQYPDIVDGASVARNQEGRVVLHVESYAPHGRLQSTADLALQNAAVVMRLDDTCPDVRGRDLMFASGQAGLVDVVIVNANPNWSVSDEFLAYDPVVSPDRRWVVFRRFYPADRVRTVSEEYSIYDLTKSRDGNRRRDVDGNLVAGLPLYPLDKTPRNGPSENAKAMEFALHTQHLFGSYSFYWSKDSRYLVFADRQDLRYIIVLVTFDRDIVHTFERTIPPDQANCPDQQFLRAATVDDGTVQVAICSRVQSFRRAEFELVPGGEIPGVLNK